MALELSDYRAIGDPGSAEASLLDVKLSGHLAVEGADVREVALLRGDIAPGLAGLDLFRVEAGGLRGCCVRNQVLVDPHDGIPGCDGEVVGMEAHAFHRDLVSASLRLHPVIR